MYENLFRFQIGAIKSVNVIEGNLKKIKFRFQIGAIKRDAM